MRFVKILFTLLIICLLAVGGISYWLFRSLHTPHQHDKSKQYIPIAKGLTPNQIIEKLAAENILASELPSEIYLRTFGDAKNIKSRRISIRFADNAFAGFEGTGKRRRKYDEIDDSRRIYAL